MDTSEKDVANESDVPRVKPEELDQHIGSYSVLWRDGRNVVGKIESVDKKDRRIIYELISGPDKGDRVRSRYDLTQTIHVYDEKLKVLALLKK